LVLHVYVLNGHLVYDLHAYAHSIYFPHVKDTQTNEFRASALHAYVPHVDFPHDVPLALANQLYVPHVIALNFYDLLDFLFHPYDPHENALHYELVKNFQLYEIHQFL